MSAYGDSVGRLIADAIGIMVGIPTPPRAWLAFAVQADIETANGTGPGAAHHNPLNLTVPPDATDPDHYWPAQVGRYSGGSTSEWHTDFAAFGTDAAGAWACAANYTAGSYPGVVDAFRGGDPVAIAAAIEASPWSTDHYDRRLDEAVADVIAREEGTSVATLSESDIREIAKAECRAVLSKEGWIRDAIRTAVRDALARAAAGLAEEAAETPTV